MGEKAVIKRTSPGLVKVLRQTLASRGILLDLTLGSLLGFTEAFFAISLASLIFSSDLPQHLPLGISIALLAAAGSLVVTSLLSSVPSGVGALQDGPNVLMALAISSLVSSLTTQNSDQLLGTVLMTMLLATAITAGLLLAMGTFRLGSLARYIPYPVVGGFLAGTGWLLMRGSFEVLTGESVTLSNLSGYLQPEMFLLWVPGLGVSLVLLFGLRRFRHALTLPILLLGLMLAFYLVLWATGTNFAEAREMGLLLGGAEEMVPQLPNPGRMGEVNWDAILGQAGNIGVLVGISLISLLLNATSLELALQKDVDLDRELRVAGVTNLFTSLAGGMVGYLSVALSTLTRRTGSRGRLPGIIAGVIVAGLLFIGFTSLAYFPMPILGGLLLFLGFDFLDEWVLKSLQRFTPIEYGVILMILIVIAMTDFLVGVGVGLIAMIIMFVVSYSRVSVVQHTLSGAEIHSNVERNAIVRRKLSQLGNKIYILELRGFLFFGTANSMVDRIRSRVEHSPESPPKFILVDFKNVTGLDSSAALSFVKSEQLAKKHAFTLVITGTSVVQQRRLQNGGLSSECDRVCYFPDMDRGLEWCEEQLLGEEDDSGPALSGDLHSQLCHLGFNEAFTSRFISYLESKTIQAGEYLIRQGESADSLFYIESGKVSVYLEEGVDDRIRLRTIHRGATVGEMGLYTDSQRSASVVAEEPTKAYRLDHQAISRMTRREPDLASAFHQWVAQMLSDRLAMATRTIEALHPRSTE